MGIVYWLDFNLNFFPSADLFVLNNAGSKKIHQFFVHITQFNQHRPDHKRFWLTFFCKTQHMSATKVSNAKSHKVVWPSAKKIW